MGAAIGGRLAPLGSIQATSIVVSWRRRRRRSQGPDGRAARGTDGCAGESAAGATAGGKSADSGPAETADRCPAERPILGRVAAGK